MFLQAALLKSSFKQNLFLEGFIRLAAEGAVGTPSDVEVTLRRHLDEPAGGDPGPRAAGIDEDLDIGHVGRVTGAVVSSATTSTCTLDPR